MIISLITLFTVFLSSSHLYFSSNHQEAHNTWLHKKLNRQVDSLLGAEQHLYHDHSHQRNFVLSRSWTNVIVVNNATIQRRNKYMWLEVAFRISEVTSDCKPCQTVQESCINSSRDVISAKMRNKFERAQLICMHLQGDLPSHTIFYLENSHDYLNIVFRREGTKWGRQEWILEKNPKF